MKLQRAELKRARIEIIPMIDTIFFLLVFFMITSLSMVQMSAKRVDMPQSSTAQDKPPEKIVITVTREADGHPEYYIDKGKVAYEEILPSLKDRIQDNPNVVVVLNVDRGQQVSEFKRVMALAQLANPTQLTIATTPKSGR